MKTLLALGMALAVALMLAGCGGGGGGANPPPRLNALEAVPNVTAGTNFSFDLGTVDSAKGRYYFTDRNNKSVDVYDTKTGTLVAQITGGFTGCLPNPNCSGANNGISGPDGINLITGTSFIYVGDANSVKIIDSTTNSVVKSIVVSNTGNRADEGCFDPDHNIYMISSPEETPPFSTFISTTTQTIIAKISFPNATGLEQCAYDHGTQSFLVNNDGTVDATNPDGEVDVIPAAVVIPGTTAAPVIVADARTIHGFKAYPEGDCDPTGLALGPGTDMAINCREATVGSSLNVLIMDRTNGHILATINAGGGDQIVYDTATNRYYSGASRWNPTGKTITSGGACTAAAPCTPVLQIIDAASRSLVTRLRAGNNAHSVAVDDVNHLAFMPFSSATAPAGCADCSAFPDGGVAIYQTE